MIGKLILTLGGSRSGKSELAERIAGCMGERVTYIATAAVGDGEIAERVRLHKVRRPRLWMTVEEEKDIINVIENGSEGDIFLVDCITVWITNLLLDETLTKLYKEKQEAYILEKVSLLTRTVERGVHLVVVSNEVGLGIVPEYPIGRSFRDLSGKANQILAARADQVYFSIAGITLDLKSLAIPIK